MQKFKPVVSKIVAIEAQQEVFFYMKPGDKIIWEREPNSWDKNAIAVFSHKKEKIGYLPKPLAKELTRRLENKNIESIMMSVNNIIGNEEVGLSCNLNVEVI